MERIEGLKTLYAEYLEEAAKVKKNASRFAGIFGLGDDPRKHPCHEAFYNNVGKWVEAFAQEQPDSACAKAAATWLLEAPGQNMQTEGYWFMYTCIGYIQLLIPLLTKEDCAALAERLNALYPKRERMPLQQETYKKLVKAAK